MAVQYSSKSQLCSALGSVPDDAADEAVETNFAEFSKVGNRSTDSFILYCSFMLIFSPFYSYLISRFQGALAYFSVFSSFSSVDFFILPDDILSFKLLTLFSTPLHSTPPPPKTPQQAYWGEDFCSGGFYNTKALADPARWDKELFIYHLFIIFTYFTANSTYNTQLIIPL
jgi:hypothetical protein